MPHFHGNYQSRHLDMCLDQFFYPQKHGSRQLNHLDLSILRLSCYFILFPWLPRLATCQDHMHC